jgi:hypothetical protein
MSLRSGLASLVSSASNVSRLIGRAAAEESSQKDDTDGNSQGGSSIDGEPSDGGDSPQDDGGSGGPPDGSSSADGSPKVGGPQDNDGVQEGDGLEGQEGLKKNKKNNLSLVCLVVCLLVVVPPLLVDGSYYVNANLCNLTEDVISSFSSQCQSLVKVLPAVCDSHHGNARINVDSLLVTTAVFSCNSTSKTLSNFCSCQSQVQLNSSVSLTVEAHCNGPGVELFLKVTSPKERTHAESSGALSVHVCTVNDSVANAPNPLLVLMCTLIGSAVVNPMLVLMCAVVGSAVFPNLLLLALLLMLPSARCYSCVLFRSADVANPMLVPVCTATVAACVANLKLVLLCTATATILMLVLLCTVAATKLVLLCTAILKL